MAYTLGNIPSDAPPWLVNELRKLQEALNAAVDGVVYRTLYAEPKRLFEGLTVVADGAAWDPLGIGLALGRPYKVCYLGGAWIQDV